MHLKRFYIVDREEQSQQLHSSVHCIRYKSMPCLGGRRPGDSRLWTAGAFQRKETAEVSLLYFSSLIGLPPWLHCIYIHQVSTHLLLDCHLLQEFLFPQ